MKGTQAVLNAERPQGFWLRYFSFFIFHFAFLVSTRADIGPQNVAVVVNAESWASLSIANAYIQLRGIPACNVIYLDGLPNFETVDIETFREKILTPVLKTIADRGLTPQIDCIAYSSDLPYAIDTSGDKLPAPRPKIFTRTASITSLTYLYQRVLAKDTSYLDLNANRYARRVKLQGDTTLTPDELKRYTEAADLLSKKEDKNFSEALPIYEELARAHPKSHEVLYNLACCQAQLKQGDAAMNSLRAAIDAGWTDIYHTREDVDLATLRERPDFKELLKALEAKTLETQPARGFRSSYAWMQNGEIDPDGKGERYMLSTMLAVTSGRGTTVNEALKRLQEAKDADGKGPLGTIYYILNGDIRSKTRRWAFQSAVNQLMKLGVKAEIIEGVLPQKKSDVMGLMAGSADFDWNSSGSTILPGAICEHLTSCGGELAQHRGQTCCTQFLRFGAAGTSGAVEEPYALQQKFPTPFMHVYYASGCTLAESFYQSVSGPYQLIIVGDPLCAPWKKAPAVAFDGIKSNAATGLLTLKPMGDKSLKSFELYIDGLKRAEAIPGRAFEINTAGFEDGEHIVSVVGISNDNLETQGRFSRTIQFVNGQPAKVKDPIKVVFTPEKLIEIQSRWFEAQKKDPAATAQGLRVTFDDGTIKIIDPTHDARWLANAGLAKGHFCTVEAWFDAPADELYQFQIQTPMSISLDVDGRSQAVGVSKTWQFVPLALKKGAHLIKLKADATRAEPVLDLRFGASGTKSIEGNQFLCVK